LDSANVNVNHSPWNVQTLDLSETNQFPALLIDYIDQKPSLNAFYNVYPNIENAKTLIEQHAHFGVEKRSVLVETLQKQYASIENAPDFSVLLDEKTFTVTTGHQLNIFTGPLYIIYKIVTTINLARALKKAYPEYHFVPIYWMATEDHDFKEIASFHLFGNTHTWMGDHTGAVGRLNPRELQSLLKELPAQPDFFAKAYLNHDTLADAVRAYMHTLFGKEGLISLDADDASLKRLFLPIIQQELTAPKSAEVVAETTQKLSDMGYHTPLHAREINLFYLVDHIRERIVKEEQHYRVLNTNINFTEQELLALTESNPERFSPNVVLRPLYEEVILPNLAYIGGPSEVPYWLQLKDLFDAYQVPFPMLIPRNFALYITDKQGGKLQKLGIDSKELFLDEVALRKIYITRHTEQPLDLAAEKEAFDSMFESIRTKALEIDVTMETAVKAKHTQLSNMLKQLETRIGRAEAKKHNIGITQLLSIKNILFPHGTAQERYDNFLTFYCSDPSFIDKLFDVFDPLSFKYYLISQES
jgi:bacillithiol biosynthesis cysteine-adding enzyme BshC